MIINLSDPFTGTIAGGIVLMIIAGTYHYISMHIKLNFTEKKLSDVLSELDTLHKNYKDEIADIKKRHGYEITRAIEHAIDTYANRMDKFLENNKPPQHRNALADALRNYKK
jgi:hypothetical protein